MSRIGNQELVVPAGCEVKIEENNVVTVKSSNGEMIRKFSGNLEITLDEGKINVKRPNDSKEMKSIHGTTTALIKNMLTGVTDGYKKELELNGVGYRANVKGNTITLSLGYSHPVVMEIPEGIKVEAPSQTELVISGIDKQAVGQFAAVIREKRKPEPYKGKGVKYKEEIIRRKEGKRAGK